MFLPISSSRLDLFLHDDPLGRDAGLPAVRNPCVHHRGGGLCQVAVSQDGVGIGATQLHHGLTVLNR